MTLASIIRSIPKGRSRKVKASANVAKMTAYRAFGSGNYSVESLGKKTARVRRVK